MISQRAQFHALFQYAQGPAHLWDSHTSALAEMEKTFQVVMSSEMCVDCACGGNCEQLVKNQL